MAEKNGRDPRKSVLAALAANSGMTPGRTYQYGGGFPTSLWQSTSYYVSPLVALDT